MARVSEFTRAGYTGNTLSGDAGLTIELRGFDELAEQLRELPEKIARQALNKSLREAAKPMLATARQLAPIAARVTRRINPGLIRRSIKIKTFKVRGNFYLARGVSIGILAPSGSKRRRERVARILTRAAAGTSLHAYFNDPYYWYFLERGTSRMAARPFLRPAFNRHRTQFLGDLEKILGKNIEAIWRGGK